MESIQVVKPVYRFGDLRWVAALTSGEKIVLVGFVQDSDLSGALPTYEFSGHQLGCLSERPIIRPYSLVLARSSPIRAAFSGSLGSGPNSFALG